MVRTRAQVALLAQRNDQHLGRRGGPQSLRPRHDRPQRERPWSRRPRCQVGPMVEKWRWPRKRLSLLPQSRSFADVRRGLKGRRVVLRVGELPN